MQHRSPPARPKPTRPSADFTEFAKLFARRQSSPPRRPTAVPVPTFEAISRYFLDVIEKKDRRIEALQRENEILRQEIGVLTEEPLPPSGEDW